MGCPNPTPSALNQAKTYSRGTKIAKSHQPEVPFPPRGAKVSQSNLIQYTPSTVLYNNVVHTRGATTNPTRATDRLRYQNSIFSGTGRDFWLLAPLTMESGKIHFIHFFIAPQHLAACRVSSTSDGEKLDFLRKSARFGIYTHSNFFRSAQDPTRASTASARRNIAAT